ncbi:MAG: branched-chain amino acid ABC transporter permease [Stellaceae bacterium]
MIELSIIVPAILDGIAMGAIYALVALGLTLIYGVLHIINFAHGAFLMLALYGVYFLFSVGGIDPYVALPIMVPAMFALGYVVQRFIIGPAGHGKDENIMLVTLGLAIIIENLALYLWTSDTRTIETSYGFATVNFGVALISVPKVVAFVGALLITLALWALMRWTDLGKAIRALAREARGAQLVGINVAHLHAMSFGIGIACLGAAACLLMPSFYADPHIGAAFVLIAFTIVVLGGMGSFIGALVGGFIIGITESLGGLFLGESLGKIGIFLIFIAVLLFRPAGLFGRRA